MTKGTLTYYQTSCRFRDGPFLSSYPVRIAVARFSVRFSVQFLVPEFRLGFRPLFYATSTAKYPFLFQIETVLFCLMKIKGKTFPLWKWIFREKTLNFERSATSGHATAKETNLRVKSLDCVNIVRGYFYFLIFIIQKGKTSFLGSFFRLWAQRENLGTHRAHNAACWWKGPFQVSQPRLWNGVHLRSAKISVLPKANLTFSDQRLRDAKISAEKKETVMKTIWERFTSDDEFYRINETDYKSQFRSRGFRFFAPYFWNLSLPPTKSRVAQSSIMKLNETSMSKLYDLMLMAVKYQCFHAHHPNEDRLS